MKSKIHKSTDPKIQNTSKAKIVTCALIMSAFLLSAQTANKPATIRIKKVENINGVETITDTTFTTNDPSNVKLPEGMNIQTINIEGGESDGNIETLIIVNDEVINGESKNMNIIQNGDGKEMDAEIKKALKEAGIDPNMKGARKMIIVNEDLKGDDKKGESKVAKIILLRCDMKNCSDEEMKQINKKAGETDGKLRVEKMNFYPNPNNGKFALSFDLPEKGDTEVMIMNMEGKSVYSEKLSNFSGNYNKEIDISKNAKGVYFVRVEQGKHAQVKKIVLE